MVQLFESFSTQNNGLDTLRVVWWLWSRCWEKVKEMVLVAFTFSIMSRLASHIIQGNLPVEMWIGAHPSFGADDGTKVGLTNLEGMIGHQWFLCRMRMRLRVGVLLQDSYVHTSDVFASFSRTHWTTGTRLTGK